MLAPAGNWNAAEQAAIVGADAVYFGVGSFNARAQAENIGSDMMPDLIALLHHHSVRAYLALNVLLSDHELQEAVKLVDQAYYAGVDALIVQDIGLLRLVRQYYPDLAVHASTQMTITDEAGLSEAARLGLKRVVLPRELTLESIRRLSSFAGNLGVETEMFVHGALCIAYSGQCFMSSVRSGRSANRGQCAQPCRLNYRCQSQNKVEGVSSRLADGPARPIISPKDQALIDYLPQLLDAGPASLKIEGRMRSVEYTAQVVAQYRSALDQILTGLVPDDSAIRERREKLLLAFNRGGAFTDRYLTDSRTDFLTGPYAGSYGLKLGTISDIRPAAGLVSIMVDLDRSRLPVRGDVLSVRQPDGSREIASVPIGSIEARGTMILVKGFHPEVLLKFHIGNPVFWMTDRASQREIEPVRTSIKITLNAAIQRADQEDENEASNRSVDAVMTVAVKDRMFAGMQVEIAQRLETEKRVMDPERIVQQLKKTGNTPFAVQSVDLNSEAAKGLPISVASLNRLRREAIEALSYAMNRERTRSHATPAFIPSQMDSLEWMNACDARPNGPAASLPDPTNMIQVWYQKLPEDDSEIACGADHYILPLWSLPDQSAQPLIDRLRQAEPDCIISVWLPPAPQNEIADWLDRRLPELRALGIDAVCSGHPGMQHLATEGLRYVVEAGANISNRIACRHYLELHPASLALSSELALSSQLAIRKDPALQHCWQQTRLTVPIYGRQRLMSSRYCPVGKNTPGCTLCHNAATASMPDAAEPYTFFDSSKSLLVLQTHPRFCTMDLLDNALYFNPDDLRLLADHQKYSFALQVSYYDETDSQRTRLIDAFRQFIQSPNSHSLEVIQTCVDYVAEQLQSPVASKKRMIFEPGQPV